MILVIRMLYNEIKYFVKSNMYVVSVLLGASLPLACFVVAKLSLRVPVALQVFLIVCIQFILYCAKWYASSIGKGQSIPVPAKRFTQVSVDGEVSIETSRVQEMMLYVADVEDYLERKGMLLDKEDGSA